MADMTHRESILHLLGKLNAHPEWRDVLLMYVPPTTIQKLLRLAQEFEGWAARGEVERDGTTVPYAPALFAAAVAKVLLYEKFVPPKNESTGYVRSAIVSLYESEPQYAPRPPAPAAAGNEWAQVQAILESQIHRGGYNTWLRPLWALPSSSPVNVTLAAPDESVRDYVQQKYLSVVRAAFQQVRRGGPPPHIEIVLATSATPEPKRSPAEDNLVQYRLQKCAACKINLNRFQQPFEAALNENDFERLEAVERAIMEYCQAQEPDAWRGIHAQAEKELREQYADRITGWSVQTLRETIRALAETRFKEKFELP